MHLPPARGQERAVLVPEIGIGDIEAIAFSPDGRAVLTAADNAAILWDPSNGKQLRALRAHTGRVMCAAFSPDSRLVVTGSEDGSVRLWDAATGAPTARFEIQDKVRAIAFSPDGRSVLAGAARLGAQLWQIESGRKMRTFHDGGMDLLSVAISPDGRYVLTGDLANTATLWNRETGAEVRTFSGTPRERPAHPVHTPPGVIVEPVMPKEIHYRWVSGVAFSPDGSQILTANEEDDALLWSTQTGKKLHTFSSLRSPLDMPGGTHSVAFSPDGRLILTSSSRGTVQTWDRATGDPVARFYGFLAVFSPEGRYVFTADKGSSAFLWTADGHNRIRTFKGETARVDSAGISRDGRLIVTNGADGRVRIWSAETGQEREPVDLNAFSGTFAGFAADGSVAILNKHMPDLEKNIPSYQSLDLKDPFSGKLLRTFKGDDSAFLSQDGRYVVTGSLRDGATLWDALGGKAIRNFARPEELNFNFLGESAPIFASIAFLPDSNSLLSTKRDSPEVEEWDLLTGKRMQSFRAKGESIDPNVSVVRSSPDGHMALTGNWDGAARLWDLNTGQQVGIFKGGDEPVASVAFSPDSHYGRILTGSWDHTVRLWDRTSGKELKRLEGHGDWVTTVGFSPDGRFALTSSLDTTAKIWDLGSGKELLTLLSFADGGWAVVDPEGRFDTNDLDGGAPLAWVVSSDPMRALPLEIFMRDYYTPRLLSRVMNHEELPHLRSIAEIGNRVQPEVSVVKVIPSPETPGRVDVVVHAVSHTDEKGVASGLQDLRLLRDGQMVANGYLEGKLKDGDFTFKNVMLKSKGAKVTFTSYAFSVERIKSETASLEYTPKPPAAAEVKKPRAYLLQIGVNHSAAPGCELQYSDNDAERLSAALTRALEAQGMAVEAVLLESPTGGDAQGASKARIHAAIAAIAAKATPDDAFFLSFSGHGYASRDGQYSMIPSDVAGSCLHVDKALLASTISADELAEWLRPVDAGEMVFVLDACHSAESVEAGEFKPGPMGSRGLGQLAYDKRMRILVASQAREVAIEYDKLQQGLLSYVLTRDGLLNNKADWKPANGAITVGEWLSYAANAVPKFNVDEAMPDGHKDVRVLGDAADATSGQVPAVFDFSKTDGFVLKRLPSAH